MEKHIVKYISQNLIDYSNEWLSFDCVVEYSDGSQSRILELRCNFWSNV